jgi:hypothetical protein
MTCVFNSNFWKGCPSRYRSSVRHPTTRPLSQPRRDRRTDHRIFSRSPSLLRLLNPFPNPPATFLPGRVFPAPTSAISRGWRRTTIILSLHPQRIFSPTCEWLPIFPSSSHSGPPRDPTRVHVPLRIPPFPATPSISPPSTYLQACHRHFFAFPLLVRAAFDSHAALHCSAIVLFISTLRQIILQIYL